MADDAQNPIKTDPQRNSPEASVQTSLPFVVDLDRLERSEIDNLCWELLTQMGYKQVEWYIESRGMIDLIAENPKRDPDGYEYNELWLVSMGRFASQKMVLDMAIKDPQYFLHHIVRDSRGIENYKFSVVTPFTLTPFTLLLINPTTDTYSENNSIRNMFERRSLQKTLERGLRVRIWDKADLTSLIQQYPQLVYKYFSDEARSVSKYRKTPEELYLENVELAKRQEALIAELKEEKNLRVRAERDAVWKDISFTAAHKIGNPIFAIETNLGPLQKRVHEQRTDEAEEIIRSIGVSVEKAKSIVEQFKSLALAQKIDPVPTLLRPLLEDICRGLPAQDIQCSIECPEDVKVMADSERLAECFDELVRNAMSWFDKPDKILQVKVQSPAPTPLPSAVDSRQSYALIRFQDNGKGVSLEKKDQIFEAFMTTRDQGTGLGLALVRRIIEGHGGAIREIGIPGLGAQFEIYLPLAVVPGKIAGKRRSVRSRGK